MLTMTTRALTLTLLALGICVVASAAGLAPEAQAMATTIGTQDECAMHGSLCVPVENQPCVFNSERSALLA